LVKQTESVDGAGEGQRQHVGGGYKTITITGSSDDLLLSVTSQWARSVELRDMSMTAAVMRI
jgi:copper(I)-binding protein